MHVAQFIKNIDKLKGKAKVAYLKEVHDMGWNSSTIDEFLVVASYCYDKQFSYHVKSIGKPNYDWLPYTDVDVNMFYHWLEVVNDKGSANEDDKYQLAGMYEGMSEDDRAIADMIIARNMRCGMTVKSIQKVFPEFLPKFPVNLVSSYCQKKIDNNITFPAFSQLKSDGARNETIFGAHIAPMFYTRNGKIYQKLDRLVELFSSGLLTQMKMQHVMDGELVVLDEDGNILPRTTGNGILNKSIKGTITQEEADRVRFVVWDLIPIDVFYGKAEPLSYEMMFGRLKHLVNLVDSDLIRIQETRIVNSLPEAKAHFTEMVNGGEEGTILKDKQGVWLNEALDGRSKSQFKFKEEHEGDFVIVDWYYGKKGSKYELCIGGFTIETLCGKVRTNVGSGLSDIDRGVVAADVVAHAESYLGTVMEGIYNNREIVDGREHQTLFLPRCTEIRFDKDADQADTLETLIEREKASREIKSIEEL